MVKDLRMSIVKQALRCSVRLALGLFRHLNNIHSAAKHLPVVVKVHYVTDALLTPLVWSDW